MCAYIYNGMRNGTRKKFVPPDKIPLGGSGVGKWIYSTSTRVPRAQAQWYQVQAGHFRVRRVPAIL